MSKSVPFFVHLYGLPLQKSFRHCQCVRVQCLHLSVTARICLRKQRQMCGGIGQNGHGRTAGAVPCREAVRHAQIGGKCAESCGGGHRLRQLGQDLHIRNGESIPDCLSVLSIYHPFSILSDHCPIDNLQLESEKYKSGFTMINSVLHPLAH